MKLASFDDNNGVPTSCRPSNHLAFQLLFEFKRPEVSIG